MNSERCQLVVYQDFVSVAHFTVLRNRDWYSWLWNLSFWLRLPLPGDTEPQHNLARSGVRGVAMLPPLPRGKPYLVKAHSVHYRC